MDMFKIQVSSSICVQLRLLVLSPVRNQPHITVGIRLFLHPADNWMPRTSVRLDVLYSVILNNPTHETKRFCWYPFDSRWTFLAVIKAWLQIVSLESFLQFTRFAIPGYPEMWLSAICAAKFLWGLTQHVLRLDVLTLRFDRDLMLGHVTKRNCTDRTGRDLTKNNKILAASKMPPQV